MIGQVRQDSFLRPGVLSTMTQVSRESFGATPGSILGRKFDARIRRSTAVRVHSWISWIFDIEFAKAPAFRCKVSLVLVATRFPRLVMQLAALDSRSKSTASRLPKTRLKTCSRGTTRLFVLGVQRVLMEATGNAAEAMMPLAMVGFILEGHTHSIGEQRVADLAMALEKEIGGLNS
eukprot:s4903_g4.t1